MKIASAQDLINDCEIVDLTIQYYIDFTGNKLLIEERKVPLKETR